MKAGLCCKSLGVKQMCMLGVRRLRWWLNLCYGSSD